MSEFSQPSINELRTAHAENAHRVGGVLYEVASAATAEQIALRPDEVADIILPPKPQEGYKARWELLDGAPGLVREAAGRNTEDILRLADRLDLRRPESVSDAELSRIDPDKATWLIEGGANRTSVVRRQLTFEVMREIYKENLDQRVVYQFGSDRPIPQQRKDRETQELKANAEYTVAQEIAPDFLPKDDSLTEFGLNLATALQSGFEIMSDRLGDDQTMVARIVQLRAANLPLLVLIQPADNAGGLKSGFDAVLEAASLKEGFQPVIATNGQYRAKDELQAEDWARANSINILPPVAIGDEPGFTVEHNGKEITTAERQPMVYVNEIVLLQRLAS